MITTEVIETILFKRIKENSVLGALPEIEKGALTPVTEENNHERISIQCNASDNEDWQHSFAYAYIYVPDEKIKGVYRKNDIRLMQLEKEARKLFTAITMGEYEGIRFWYQAEKGDGFKKEKEIQTWSHVITVKLKVTNANFKI